jgi:hypothetical protein
VIEIAGEGVVVLGEGARGAIGEIAGELVEVL